MLLDKSRKRLLVHDLTTSVKRWNVAYRHPYVMDYYCFCVSSSWDVISYTSRITVFFHTHMFSFQFSVWRFHRASVAYLKMAFAVQKWSRIDVDRQVYPWPVCLVLPLVQKKWIQILHFTSDRSVFESYKVSLVPIVVVYGILLMQLNRLQRWLVRHKALLEKTSPSRIDHGKVPSSISRHYGVLNIY